jgi:chromosomal replication initiator protein
VSWDGVEITVEVASGFSRDWLKRYHAEALAEAVSRAAGRRATVKMVVNPALAPEPLAPSPPAVVAAPARRTGAPDRYTFDAFVVGESNEVAFRAARAIVEQPGARFNPLFIYGGVGLGKTHLLCAVGSALNGCDGARVACLSAENFVNEMIAALRRDQMERFRQRFRRIGTLIVDDVQFLAGKVRSQEEFTHTFNALHDGRRQIVLASDRAPHELPGIEATLRSRFASGLLADVRSPDPQLRIALVERKAAVAGMELCADVVRHLARHWCHNVRELEGTLARVDAFASLSRREITLPLVREALAPYAKRSCTVTMERIVGEVCLQFGVTRAELLSDRRTARLVLPRQLVMYLCRQHTDVPLKAIGGGLGGRDHSTVVHALAAIERRLREDGALRATLAALESRLAS